MKLYFQRHQHGQTPWGIFTNIATDETPRYFHVHLCRTWRIELYWDRTGDRAC